MEDDGTIRNFITYSRSSSAMEDQFTSNPLLDSCANDLSFDYDSLIGRGRCSVMSLSEEDDNSLFYLSHSFAGSTLTELSSVFSMSEDEFDRLASRQAQELFDNIDSVLYEHINTGPSHSIKECHEWSSTFLHLRVLGHQIVHKQDDGFLLYPMSTQTDIKDIIPTLETTQELVTRHNLLVNGTRVDAVPVQARSLSSQAYEAEEVIEENGTMEEIFAIDYSDDDSWRQRMNERAMRALPPRTPANCFKDNILSSLFNRILLEMTPSLKPLFKRFLENQSSRNLSSRNHSRNEIKLEDELLSRERMNESEVLPDSSSNYLENTAKSSLYTSILSTVPEDAPLQGLLTVQSKTLVNRERTLDGSVDNSTTSQSLVSTLKPGMNVYNGSNHLPERRSSLNRLRLTPFESNKLQSILPTTESDNLMNLTRGRRLTSLSPYSNQMSAQTLPPLQVQRTTMSANLNNINININRSMHVNRRSAQRALSAVPEKDMKLPYREKDKSSLSQDYRPNTTLTTYNTDKKNENLLSVSRQSTSLLHSNIVHRPSTALSAKALTPPSLHLSGSSITPRRTTEKTGSLGSGEKSSANEHLNMTNSPFNDIMQVSARWNPLYHHLNRNKVYRNLESGLSSSALHPRLLQMRPTQQKTTNVSS